MITTDKVKKIAKLAKLEFDNNEIANFQRQLSNILNMIDELKEVDCSGIVPLASVCNMTQRMREDKVSDSDISEELFANVTGKNAELAKEVKCFIVPKMVE